MHEIASGVFAAVQDYQKKVRYFHPLVYIIDVWSSYIFGLIYFDFDYHLYKLIIFVSQQMFRIVFIHTQTQFDPTKSNSFSVRLIFWLDK